jgi:diaminopimelate decarboxylase
MTQAFGEVGLPVPKLMQEPGRSMVAEAGTTLYTVGAVKTVRLPGGGEHIYVAVDGGLSDNPRPQLYGAKYQCYVAGRHSEGEPSLCRIAGAHCETDTLISEIRMVPPRTGDLLAVPCTGAYCYSMASNYNRFARPAVVLVNDGQADIIVEREGVDDILRQDRIPARLIH